VKGKRPLFERFDKDTELAQCQKRIDVEMRRRGVVLNRIVVIDMAAAGAALEVRAACDQRRPDFMNAGERRADAGCLAGELLEDEGVRLRLRDVCAGMQGPVGLCGDACGHRQEPQHRDAANLDQEACDGSPQPRPLFHRQRAVTTG
jgi:hypothetical protein